MRSNSVKRRVIIQLEGENQSMFLSVTAFMMIGMLMLLAGIFYLNEVWGFMEIEEESYQITKLILSGIVILMAVHSFSKHLITEGMTVLLIGLSSLIYSITAMGVHSSGYLFLDVLFSVGILVSAALSLYKRNWLVGMGSLVLAVTMAVTVLFTGAVAELIYGFGLLASGTLFSYYAFGCIILGETGINLLRISLNRNREVPEDADRPYELTAVTGLLVMGLSVALASSEYVTDPSALQTYCVAQIVIALTVAVLACYAIGTGIVVEGVLMLAFSMDALIYSIVSGMGLTYSPLVGGALSIVLLSVMASFFLRREFVLSLVAALVASSYVVDLLGVQGASVYLLGAGAVLLIYYSVSKWTLMVVGRQLLPIR